MKNKVCFGCFHEFDGMGKCPLCGFDESKYDQIPSTLPIGILLNHRYLIGRVLGVGGFGVTYIALDKKLDRVVAVKEYLPSGIAMRDNDHVSVVVRPREEQSFEHGMERFLGEAKILARLQRISNIVTVFDFFPENNTAYFVMEFIEGINLYEYTEMRGGKLSFEEARDLLLPMMNSLSKVHNNNLLHRDISPDNILISNEGVAFLIDFGAARQTVDHSKSVIVKNGFAPEEQYRSHGEQGPQTDEYAFAATLYRIITGKLPPESLDRVYDDNILSPMELGISIPKYANNAIMKALSVQANDRFPDMRKFADAISGKNNKNESDIPTTVPVRRIDSKDSSGHKDVNSYHPPVQIHQPYKPDKNLPETNKVNAIPDEPVTTNPDKGRETKKLPLAKLLVGIFVACIVLVFAGKFFANIISNKRTETLVTEDVTNTSDENVSTIDGSTEEIQDLNRMPFEVKHDLASLDVRIEYECRGYAAHGQKDAYGMDQDGVTSFKRERIVLQNGSDKVKAVVNDIYDKQSVEEWNNYIESVDQLKEWKNENHVLGNSWYGAYTVVYREDNRVLSFCVVSAGEEKTYNINCEDGTMIEFDDVVKDRQAIIEYLRSLYTSTQKETTDNLISIVIDNIQDGTAQFAIFYNGIEVKQANSRYGVFVPVIGNESALNTFFFEATPQTNYTIESNGYSQVIWDIDDDGEIDNLYVVLANDNEYSIDIYWDGRLTSFNKDDIPLLGDENVNAFFGNMSSLKIMYAANSCYLYMETFGEGGESDEDTYGEDGIESIYLFSLCDGEIKYCDSLHVWDLNHVRSYVPNNIVSVIYLRNVIGSYDLYQDYSIDENGRFAPNGLPHCDYYHVTRSEITALRLDQNGNSNGEIIIPAGTNLACLAYDEKQNVAYMRIQMSDETDGQSILLYLDTIRPDEAFYDVHYSTLRPIPYG